MYQRSAVRSLTSPDNQIAANCASSALDFLNTNSYDSRQCQQEDYLLRALSTEIHYNDVTDNFHFGSKRESVPFFESFRKSSSSSHLLKREDSLLSAFGLDSRLTTQPPCGISLLDDYPAKHVPPPPPPLPVHVVNNVNELSLASKAIPASLRERIAKTKICLHNLSGQCTRAANCSFAHSAKELRKSPDLYKTRLCINYMSVGCTKSNSCRFAHGREELRWTPDVMRTSICLDSHEQRGQKFRPAEEKRRGSYGFNDMHDEEVHHKRRPSRLAPSTTDSLAVCTGKHYQQDQEEQKKQHLAEEQLKLDAGLLKLRQQWFKILSEQVQNQPVPTLSTIPHPPHHTAPQQYGSPTNFSSSSPLPITADHNVSNKDMNSWYSYFPVSAKSSLFTINALK